jgi:hypothetical protein
MLVVLIIETSNGGRTTCSLLYANTQNLCFKVSKIHIKILQIANDIYYNVVKYQYKLLHILAYTLITNSNLIVNNGTFQDYKFVRFC